MKFLNFGSINIDHIYNVVDFAKPGETIVAKHYVQVLGGKGANQSVALAKAGADVYHSGLVNRQQSWIYEELQKWGVNTNYAWVTESQDTGHAVIQVDQNGENSIMIFGGANHQIDEEQIKDVLSYFEKDDILVLQNEINELKLIMSEASAKGMKICFNPAPFTKDVIQLDFSKIDCLIVNESEAIELLKLVLESDEKSRKHYLTNRESQMKYLKNHLKTTFLVHTQGEKGATLYFENKVYFQPSSKVNVIDTTGAGDCFIGYLLANLYAKGHDQKVNEKIICHAMSIACEAAAQSIQIKGGAHAIAKVEL